MEFYSISGIVIIVLMVLLAVILWKVSKILLIPIQIILFLILMYVAYEYFVTQGNVNKISSGINEIKIEKYVNEAKDSAVQLINRKMDEGKKALEEQTAEKIQAGIPTGNAAAKPSDEAAKKTAEGPDSVGSGSVERTAEKEACPAD